MGWNIHRCQCGHPSCSQFTLSNQGSAGFEEADAKLMAAAPELLAACEEFVRKCDSGEARSKVSYSQMKAAIALAKAAS